MAVAIEKILAENPGSNGSISIIAMILTPYQVNVFIPEEEVAFTSDNIFYKVGTYLRQAQPYDLLDSLKRIEAIDADVLVPGHGGVCNKSYIPEMRTLINDWIAAVSAAIEEGMSLEEAQAKITFRDPYLVEHGNEESTHRVHLMNVARLYEV
jgi:glyoxylase-like metal-dependent hydrolase (beta-lactamase superfamily II)